MTGKVNIEGKQIEHNRNRAPIKKIALKQLDQKSQTLDHNSQTFQLLYKDMFQKTIIKN